MTRIHPIRRGRDLHAYIVHDVGRLKYLPRTRQGQGGPPLAHTTVEAGVDTNPNSGPLEAERGMASQVSCVWITMPRTLRFSMALMAVVGLVVK